MGEYKFGFDLEFQEEGLRFIINNPDGHEAMAVVKSSYFDSLYHSIIFHGIEVFYKKNGRIPSKPFLLNLLGELFTTRDYIEAITQEDEKLIHSMVDNLYLSPVRDGDLILQALYKFSAYVELQKLNEEMDFENFQNYESYAKKVSLITEKGDYIKTKETGVFLIKDIKERQMKRQASDIVVPTPYFQLNSLTSAGGYEPGSIMVILDKPKRLKTTFLVNTARKYMASKVKVLYIDLENGQNSIAARLEQSIGRVTKKDIIKGTKDKDIQKILRRYRRLGGEVYIRRLPALSTAQDIQKIIDKLYRREGIVFGALMIDYLALMGSNSGKKEEFDRISEAYVDVANLLQKNPSISHCWTANHVQRTAVKRAPYRYAEEDIAKCIDIVRHAQGIMGLNRTQAEFDNGVVRLEVVMQREGVPTGRAYFRVDAETQRMDELTRKEITDLKANGILYNPDEADRPDEEPEDKPKKRGDI